MKNSFIKLFVLSIFTHILMSASCSSDDGVDDNTSDPTQQNDDGNSTSPPSNDPPTGVFIVNMNVSGIGDRAGILGCNRLPIQNDMYLRDSLGLADEMFFGIYGANYNEDGSFPQGLNDFGGPSSPIQGRNKMSLTYILKDDETANAALIVRDALGGKTIGIPSTGCGDPAFDLSKYDCEFRVLEQGSDALGGFDKINYSYEDVPFFSEMYYRIIGDGQYQTFGEYLSTLRVQDTVIKVRVIETVKVQDGERVITYPDL